MIEEDTAIPPDFDFAPWDGRRTPVTMIGGYLGAGKTTLINHLLARTDRPIAVVVNDVGSVNIDSSLIARRHNDTLELTNGCVCCEINDSLASVFDQLRARPEPPDHLIIELSGVADPGPVRPWTNSPGFRLDGVVVLADAEQVVERAEDPIVGELVRRQIAESDVVVITKVDLVSPERRAEVEEYLQNLAPDRPLFASDGSEALAGLLDTATRRPHGVTDVGVPTLFDRHEVITVSLPDPISEDGIDDLLQRAEDDAEADGGLLVRAKGVARTPDGRHLLIQVVGRRRRVTPLPAAEHEAPTDLVVIRIPANRSRIPLRVVG